MYGPIESVIAGLLFSNCVLMWCLVKMVLNTITFYGSNQVQCFTLRYRFDSSITNFQLTLQRATNYRGFGENRKLISSKPQKNFLQTVENLLNPLQNTQKWYIFAIFAILKAKNRFLVESAMRNIFYNSKSIWEHLDLGNSSVVWIICMRVRITALSEILNFPTISWFLRKFSFGLCRIQFWRWIFRHICIDIVIHIWLFGVNK